MGGSGMGEDSVEEEEEEEEADRAGQEAQGKYWPPHQQQQHLAAAPSTPPQHAPPPSTAAGVPNAGGSGGGGGLAEVATAGWRAACGPFTTAPLVNGSTMEGLHASPEPRKCHGLLGAGLGAPTRCSTGTCSPCHAVLGPGGGVGGAPHASHQGEEGLGDPFEAFGSDEDDAVGALMDTLLGPEDSLGVGAAGMPPQPGDGCCALAGLGTDPGAHPRVHRLPPVLRPAAAMPPQGEAAAGEAAAGLDPGLTFDLPLMPLPHEYGAVGSSWAAPVAASAGPAPQQWSALPAAPAAPSPLAPGAVPAGPGALLP